MSEQQKQPIQIHPATIGLKINSMVTALIDAIEKQSSDINALVEKLKQIEGDKKVAE